MIDTEGAIFVRGAVVGAILSAIITSLLIVTLTWRNKLMATNEKIQMLYDMTQRYKEAAEQETDLDKMEALYKKAIEFYGERVSYQREVWDEGND